MVKIYNPNEIRNPDWELAEHMTFATSPRLSVVVRRSFLAGISSVEQPFFGTDFSGIRSISSDPNDQPYPDRDLYQYLADYMAQPDFDPYDAESIVNYWVVALDIAATVIPLPTCLLVAIDYNGTDKSASLEWQDASRFRLGFADIVVGYDGFYSGVSLVGQPVTEV